MRDLRQLIVTGFLHLAIVGSGAVLFGTGGAQAQGPEGMEILTRGPVHEAYAELIGVEVGTGMLIENAPPQAIEEIPPEDMPEGDEVAWIPGYWGWDEERNDFLWISGIWRVPPPNSSWTPGYWAQWENGFQWVAGFWLPNDVQEINYLPAPPASLDEGPQSDPPSPDHIWVSGNWVWPQDHYVWQPGYWVEARPDWVYTPTHYNWTPRGYVHVNGYWDYPIANRGVLFAPVYFSQPIYRQSSFRYSPNVLIDSGGLTLNLFRYPRYNHYVFGDYYGNDSRQLGIVPWFHTGSSRRSYDPIYAHQSWKHGRDDSKWSDRLQADYRRREENVQERPPRLFAHSENSDLSHPDRRSNNQLRARTLEEAFADKDSDLKLIRIDQVERDTRDKTGRDLRRFAEDRAKRETAQAEKADGASADEVKVQKLPAPKSPINRAQVTGKDDKKAPPELPRGPEPDATTRGDRRDQQADEPVKGARDVVDPVQQSEPKPVQAPRERVQREEKEEAPSAEGARNVAPGSAPPAAAPKASSARPNADRGNQAREEQAEPKPEKIDKPDPNAKPQNQTGNPRSRIQTEEKKEAPAAEGARNAVPGSAPPVAAWKLSTDLRQ